MGYYKALLVDDEQEIRDGIQKKIDWNRCGFELAGTAENGREALDLAEKTRPDVILTDIKMPFMSGLQLGEILAERLPDTKLVLFSGFDDFEYAQKAIQLNVMEYILKPIDAAELSALLLKLKNQLDDEFAKKRNLQILKENYEKSLPILTEQFLGRILEGKITEERIQNLSKQYHMDLSSPFWTVAIFHGEPPNTEDSAFHNEQELIPVSLKNIVDEVLHPFRPFKSFLFSDDVVCILFLEQKEQVMELVQIANRIVKLAKRFLEFSAYAGIGLVCDTIMSLKYSYQGAKDAAAYHVILGHKAIYIGDVEPDFTVLLQFDQEAEQKLFHAVKLESPEEIPEIIKAFVFCVRDSHMSLSQCQRYLTEIWSAFIKLTRNYQLNAEQIFGQDLKGIVGLPEYESLEELNLWFTDIALKINEMLQRERRNSSSQLTEKAKQFIEENFEQCDISVEMLCNHLHMSPAYFSTIFKRETGVSFITYLTETRMKEAVRLLETTNDKTYVIAQKVGYTESNYFSYVFKKKFGVSPSQYRSNHP